SVLPQYRRIRWLEKRRKNRTDEPLRDSECCNPKEQMYLQEHFLYYRLKLMRSKLQHWWQWTLWALRKEPDQNPSHDLWSASMSKPQCVRSHQSQLQCRTLRFDPPRIKIQRYPAQTTARMQFLLLQLAAMLGWPKE